jgi:hypothetical protein
MEWQKFLKLELNRTSIAATANNRLAGVNTKSSKGRILIMNHMLLVTWVVLALVCFNCSSRDKANKAYKGTILIEFNLSAAIIENSKPVFMWNPREQIVASLKAAGYKVTSKKKKQHNLALKITYDEGPEYVARQPIHWIEEISFILEDSTGAILMKEKRTPILGQESSQEAIKSFADDLPNFINERLEAEDEFSFVNGLLQRKGFNIHRFRRLVQLQDPRTAEALLPHLTTCGTQSRWEVRWALEDLGFEPRTAWEKAAFDMVTLERPSRYSSGRKIRKTSGAYSIAKHGITAIELFLEDLKCADRRYVIAENARFALSNLTKQRWWKSSGSFDHRWNEFTVARLTDALKAAREDSTNLAAMDERYIEKMIDVLGDIADSHATELLQAYASYPQWAKVADEAVKKIARRSGTWTSIDLYYNERQVETEYEVMEHSIKRGPFNVSDKQIIQELIETAKQKGANAVIIEGVLNHRIYTEETGKKERIIEVTFIKYKILS